MNDDNLVYQFRCPTGTVIRIDQDQADGTQPIICNESGWQGFVEDGELLTP